MNGVSRRRFLQLAAGVGAVSSVPGLRAAALARPGTDAESACREGEWLAGDFHVHTTHSHDVWGGPDDDNTDTPEEMYTLGWTPAEQLRNAELRGLHFVALTDHNRIATLDDPGYSSGAPGLIRVHGYEHSMRYGHAGVFIPDPAALRAAFVELKTAESNGGLDRFLEIVHAAGGVAVINHPQDHGTWEAPPAISTGFDAIEAWNSSWLQRDNVTPRVYTNNYLAAQWWEQEFLTRGRKGITGGSDNHWRATTAVQGVGQPTTWVFAKNCSAAAIVEGVQAGRTFVSSQPPAFGGARLFLTAAEDWRNGKDKAVMPGGSVRPLGSIAVAVTVEGGAGQRLRLISTGGVVRDEAVTSPIATHTFNVVLPQGGWLRAELYADPGYAMSAITSAVYADPTETAPDFARKDPTATTALSYASPLDVLPRHTEELPF